MVPLERHERETSVLLWTKLIFKISVHASGAQLKHYTSEPLCSYFDKLRKNNIHSLTLCMLGNFSCFCCRLLTFFSKLTFSKNFFRNTIRVSNGLDPDQDRHSVGPDLSPNSLQRLSTDDKAAASKQSYGCCFSSSDYS